jgi:outer membrane lipoprotein-sorting protein
MVIKSASRLYSLLAGRIFGRAIIFIVCLLASSCAPHLPEPGQKPLPDAAAILEKLNRHQQHIKSYTGHGRLKLISPQQSFVANVHLAAISPGSFRLSAADFFGRSILTLVVNEGEFYFLDHRRARLYVGQASQKNLDYLLSTGLEFSELIELFAGGYFISSPKRMELARSDNTLARLTLFENNSLIVQRIYLNPPDMRVIRIERSSAEEEPFLLVNYSDYRRLNGREVPFRIELKLRQSYTELTLSYKGFELNPELERNIFVVETAPEIEVIQVGD